MSHDSQLYILMWCNINQNYTFSCAVTWLTTTYSHVMSHDPQLHTLMWCHMTHNYTFSCDVTWLTLHILMWCHMTHNYTFSCDVTWLNYTFWCDVTWLNYTFPCDDIWLTTTHSQVMSHDSQLHILRWCHMTHNYTFSCDVTWLNYTFSCNVTCNYTYCVAISEANVTTLFLLSHTVSVSLSCNMIPKKFWATHNNCHNMSVNG